MSTIINDRSILGESPVWNHFDQRFYWVDILGKKIKRYDDRSDEPVKIYEMEKMPTCLGLIDSNQILTVVEDGIGVFDLRDESWHDFRVSSDEPIDFQKVRFNDGKVDRSGILHIGTMDRNGEKPLGSIYRLESDHLTTIDRGIGISNGISFSKDNQTMYYADSLVGEIYRKSNDPLVKDRETIHRYDTLNPDGSTVDSEDRYYSCLWGGSRIDVLGPSDDRTIGGLERSIGLGIKYPTCCCFGGDDLDKLFITSASVLDNSGNNGKIGIVRNYSTGIKETSVNL